MITCICVTEGHGHGHVRILRGARVVVDTNVVCNPWAYALRVIRQMADDATRVQIERPNSVDTTDTTG